MYDVNETTVVQVTNNGPKALTYKYASHPYLIPPGRTANVPYYAACTWFGNPRAIDEGGPEDRDRNFRTDEVERMSVLYGLHGGSWRSPVPYTQTDFMDSRIGHEYVRRADGDYWHPNLPNVTVTTLDGETLPMVVTDPAGDSITPAEASTRSEQKATTAAIDSLQQQLHSLRLQLARQQEGAPANPDTPPNSVTETPDALPEARPSTILGPTIDAPAEKRGPGRPRKAS